MHEFEASWAWFAISAAALWAKYVGLALVQASYRIRKGMVGTPEDQKFIRAAPAQEDAFLMRVAAAFRNDHESIPIFLACGAAFSALGGSPQIASWLFPAYAVSRIIHTIVYLNGWQPARFIAWLSGTVICGILVLQNVVIALRMLEVAFSL